MTAALPPPKLDERPVVAMFRAPVFNASEGFVQAQAAGLTRYQPLLVGLRHLGNVTPALRERLLLAASPAERLGARLGRWGALGRRVAHFSPALVHAQFGTDGLAALPLARALGVPLLTSLRGYDVARSSSALLRSGRLSWIRYALLRRRLMAGGDLFLAVSDALRRAAVAQGFPEARTFTHYNGVDLARFRPDQTPEPGLILFVGRLVEKKGTGTLLAAFTTVRRACPEARLEIVGDGPLGPALRRQAAQLGVANAVRFTGMLSPDAVADRLRCAWLLAGPSLTARDGDAEGLPNAVVEAAASGVPVIGSRHAGIPEAVEDGRTGFLVPEADADALAAKLIDLLRSPDLRGRFGLAARRLAEQRFDAVRQSVLLEAHYDRLLGRT